MDSCRDSELTKFFAQITAKFQNWEAQTFSQMGTKDLSIKELNVLETVSAKTAQGRNTMTEVAAELSIRISSLTTAATALVRKGYLQREQVAEDRRIIRLRLTPKGEAANKLHSALQAQMTHRVSELLDEHQMDSLLNSLNHIDTLFKGRPNLTANFTQNSTSAQKGTPNMSIQFLTDSTADILPQEGASRNIGVVPLLVNFADVSYRDGEDIDHATFYEKLVAAEGLPTTSQPTPQEFLPAFEAAKEAGTQLICVMLSGNLSGTYQSACIAKEICDYDGIYVVDSRSAVCGIRLLIDLGIQLRDQGLTAPQIVAELEEARTKVRLVALADTLTYLHKGGRVSSAVNIAGALMRVKPVFAMVDGKLDLFAKGMGVKDGVTKIVKSMEGKTIDSRLPLYVGYTRDEALSQKLIGQLQEVYPQNPIENHSVGAVIGTHIGPSATVVAYLEG